MNEEARRCIRCQSKEGLRLKDSLNFWREGLPAPIQMNFYICTDQRACSVRVNEVGHFLKDKELWLNYRNEIRPRRYTPRKYWNDGHRLTFMIARLLFLQVGMELERGQSSFPKGLKSGYIVSRSRRYTSLLKAIELLDEKPKKKAKRQRGPCSRKG